MNIPIDTIITILVIGSFAFSIFNNISKATREAQKRSMEQSELERQNAERERQRREADPNTQSMQSYLERTRPGKLEQGAPDDFRQPSQTASRPGSFGADLAQSGQISEQERLRREMARKMGNAPQSSTTASTTSRNQPQSLEDLLRDFTKAVETRQSQPTAPARPTSTQNTGRTPSRPTSATPRPAPQPVPKPIESSIRPSMTTSNLFENQDVVVNVSAAQAERVVAAERESQGASSVSKGMATRSWSSATTGDIVRAVIWTEILNPPKSRRR